MPKDIAGANIKVGLDFIGKGVGVTKTQTVIFDNVIVEQFGIGDVIYLHQRLPIQWVKGDVKIHIGFIPMGAETGKTCNWEINYRAHGMGEVLLGSDGILTTGDKTLPSTQYEMGMGVVTIPVADLDVNNHIHVRLKRIASSNDSTSDPAILHVTLEYEVSR